MVNIIISKAKYEKAESIKVVSGTINYSVQNVNIIHVKEQANGNYTEKTSIPKGSYTLNTTSSYCIQKPNTTAHLTGVTFNYNSTAGTISITGIPTIKVTCHLYFDKLSPSDTTLAMLGQIPKGTVTDFNKTACDANTNNSSHNGSNCESTDKGVYQTTDADGPTYYYRGTVDNNWVKFANMWWRIIRINGNGSIRLIYSGTIGRGTQPTDTSASGNGKWVPGDNSQLASTSIYNSSSRDNTYVGYYYGATGAANYGAAHTNATPSSIAGVINSWYETSGLNSYAAKLDGTTGWCNDRTPYAYSGLSASSKPDNANYGYGRAVTSYGAYFRRSYSHQPTYTCSSNDLFTLSGSTTGNKKLPAPVGLITADEVMYAGGRGADNCGYWLYTGNVYWTMSPYNYVGSNAYVSAVNAYGYLAADYVGSTDGVRPVINLKAGTTLVNNGTGEKGTINNPYEVSN